MSVEPSFKLVVVSFPATVTSSFANVIRSVSLLCPIVVPTTFPSRLEMSVAVVPLKTSEVFVASVSKVNFP